MNIQKIKCPLCDWKHEAELIGEISESQEKGLISIVTSELGRHIYEKHSDKIQ